ncbi:hypothetical protein [Nonomuraea wenchangensis]
MTAVAIEIVPKPAPRPDVEVIDDLATLIGPEKCSCSAGDDQPY